MNLFCSCLLRTERVNRALVAHRGRRREGARRRTSRCSSRHDVDVWPCCCYKCLGLLSLHWFWGKKNIPILQIKNDAVFGRLWTRTRRERSSGKYANRRCQCLFFVVRCCFAFLNLPFVVFVVVFWFSLRASLASRRVGVYRRACQCRKRSRR